MEELVLGSEAKQDLRHFHCSVYYCASNPLAGPFDLLITVPWEWILALTTDKSLCQG